MAYTDPYGLLDSIRFADEDAERLFRSAVRVYSNVQGLDRTKTRIINDFLKLVERVENSETEHLLVQTGPMDGGVGSFDDKPNPQVLTIDTDDIKRQWDVYRPIATMGHELGHFYDHNGTWASGLSP